MNIVGSEGELAAQGVVEVVVPDLPAALTFYRQLGFVVERETPGFVTLRWESMFLFVAENQNAPTAHRWTNIRIMVPDADAVWQRVKQLGLPVGNPIADRAYGLRDFTVKDPAGFEVRFAEVLRA
jgi:catechol 2,3-dioxygenase-like lactoylglutathione lyase family enzyme